LYRQLQVLRQESRGYDPAMRKMLALLTLVTCLAAAPPTATTPRPAAATTPSAVGPFASFGVIPTPPPAAQGWKRMLEGGTGHIVRWMHMGASGKADAIMVLEMEPAKGRTAEQYAAALAQRMKGKATKDPTLFGGQPASRVVGERQPGAPSEALVTSNNDYVYVVSAFADSAELMPRAAINQVATQLKFVPLAEPSAFTALRDEKFPLFKKFVIQPLDNMRPNPEPPGEGQVGVSTFNFRAGKPDFIMTIQYLPNQAGVGMNVLQQQFPGKLNPQAKATWKKIGSTIPAELSSTFEAQMEGQAQKTRVGLVLLPPQNDIVMVFFSLVTEDPKAIAAYEQASEKILASIAPLAQ
jgi:hypothetical protein